MLPPLLATTTSTTMLPTLLSWWIEHRFCAIKFKFPAFAVLARPLHETARAEVVFFWCLLICHTCPSLLAQFWTRRFCVPRVVCSPTVVKTNPTSAPKGAWKLQVNYTDFASSVQFLWVNNGTMYDKCQGFRSFGRLSLFIYLKCLPTAKGHLGGCMGYMNIRHTRDDIQERTHAKSEQKKNVLIYT